MPGARPNCCRRCKPAKAHSRSAGRAARPETEQMSAALAEGILERLKELMQRARRRSRSRAPSDSRCSNGAADRASCARTRRPRRAIRAGQQSAGERILNEMLRAINRSSIGQREVAGGAGEAAQEGSQSNVGGGAMGRRVGTSRAGAGDGEPPPANPAGDAESEPVLGDKTVRLEAQLEKVKVEAARRRGSAGRRRLAVRGNPGPGGQARL